MILISQIGFTCDQNGPLLATVITCNAAALTIQELELDSNDTEVKVRVTKLCSMKSKQAVFFKFYAALTYDHKISKQYHFWVAGQHCPL